MDVESSTLSRYASWLGNLSVSGGFVSAGNPGTRCGTGNAPCLPELAISHAIIRFFLLTMRSEMQSQFSKGASLGLDAASLGQVIILWTQRDHPGEMQQMTCIPEFPSISGIRVPLEISSWSSRSPTGLGLFIIRPN